MESEHALDAFGVAWRLGATLLLVVLNGFFVAAEFALVKVRRAQVEGLAGEGRMTARAAKHVLDHLDHYLSACQLGITIASLVLGALGEPAVGAVIVALLELLGVSVTAGAAWLRWTSVGLAFTVITVLHMTLGEQAPKMWALKRPLPAVLATALPLRMFTALFTPVIAIINRMSNAMLRAVGISSEHGHEQIPTQEELKNALALSAEAGNISAAAHKIAENVFRAVDMEVRHILCPRFEVVSLSLQKSREENLETMRSSGHSRFPLVETDLDDVIGIVHSKDVFSRQGEGKAPDLRELARKPTYVPLHESLGDFMTQLRRERMHGAIVVDERGSTVGMAFLEDAIEEVVGPIADEFDEPSTGIVKIDTGIYEIAGSVPLPDVADLLGIDLDNAEGSTLGGHVIALLGRLPKEDDEVKLPGFRARIIGLTRRRVVGRVYLEALDENGNGKDDEKEAD